MNSMTTARMTRTIAGPLYESKSPLSNSSKLQRHFAQITLAIHAKVFCDLRKSHLRPPKNVFKPRNLGLQSQKFGTPIPDTSGLQSQTCRDSSPRHGTPVPDMSGLQSQTPRDSSPRHVGTPILEILNPSPPDVNPTSPRCQSYISVMSI